VGVRGVDLEPGNDLLVKPRDATSRGLAVRYSHRRHC